ncbi:MAG TPA: hypothetical protein VNA89_01415 [Gemmatimonadaceae bacterium]|nr:hypothetical protein [Gemmatimonadaceae bacterium]
MRGLRAATEPKRRRIDGTWLVSIVVHVVAIVGLWSILRLPYPLSRYFRDQERAEFPVERIGFIRLPVAEVPQPGERGGDDRPARADRPEATSAPIVAPVETPTAVPPTPAAPVAPVEEAGTGPAIGGGGPTRGVRPTFADPRVWGAPGPLVVAPKTPDERLDSVIVSSLQSTLDSIALAQRARKPGDWTVERDGKKYGWDEKGIRLGSFTLPQAVLALLPLNVQANPRLNDPTHRTAAMREDLLRGAQTALNEQEFKNRVRAIRQRKDREREEARRRAREQGRPIADEPVPE